MRLEKCENLLELSVKAVSNIIKFSKVVSYPTRVIQKSKSNLIPFKINNKFKSLPRRGNIYGNPEISMVALLTPKSGKFPSASIYKISIIIKSKLTKYLLKVRF